MTHKVFCHYLQKEADGLSEAPYPNAAGQRIYEHISQAGWDAWIGHQTMLINEYKLSMLDPKSREFLLAEMEKFLFQGNAQKPPGFEEE